MKKNILITGAARRIGKCIAEAFASSGCDVAIHYRDSRAEAEALGRELSSRGVRAVLCRADFREQDAPASVFEQLSRQDFEPEILVNSASVYSRVPLAELTPPQLAELYAVNFFAPYELMRIFARRGHGDCIINLLDQRVAYDDPTASGYAFAKKSLRDATLACALEWAPRLRVNAVAPGLVMSPPGVPPERLAGLAPRIPLGRVTPPEDVAAACLYLARTDSVTGQVLYVDGGLHLLGHSVETAGRKGNA